MTAVGRVQIDCPASGGGFSPPASWTNEALGEFISYTIPGPGYYRVSFVYTASGNYFQQVTVNGTAVVPASGTLGSAGLQSHALPYQCVSFSLLLRADAEKNGYRLTDILTGADFGVSDKISPQLASGGGIGTFSIWSADT